jgi:hypothetical protein
LKVWIKEHRGVVSKLLAMAARSISMAQANIKKSDPERKYRRVLSVGTTNGDRPSPRSGELNRATSN